MKKFIILLVVSFLVTSLAYALPDKLPAVEAVGNQVIKATGGMLVDLSVYYQGVTAGDKIQILNGNTVTSPAVLTIVAPTANGSTQYVPSTALYVDQGIYYKETKSGGTFGADIKFQ